MNQQHPPDVQVRVNPAGMLTWTERGSSFQSVPKGLIIWFVFFIRTGCYIVGMSGI